MLTVPSKATLLKGLPGWPAACVGGPRWAPVLPLRGLAPPRPGRQTRGSSSRATGEAPVPLGPGVTEPHPPRCHGVAPTVAPRRNRERWPQRPRGQGPGGRAPGLRPCRTPPSARCDRLPREPRVRRGPRFCACALSFQGRRQSREEGVSRSREPRGRVPSELPTPGTEVLSPYLLAASSSVSKSGET